MMERLDIQKCEVEAFFWKNPFRVDPPPFDVFTSIFLKRQQIDEEAVAPGCQFSNAAPGRFGGNARGETLFQLGSQRRIAQGHVPPCHSMRSSLLTRRWRE